MTRKHRGADHPSLNDWKVYGGTWVSYEAQSCKPEDQICNKCGQPSGIVLWTTEGSPGKEVGVEYTVSDDSAVVVQGLKDPEVAKLIALAPELRDLATAVAAEEAGTRKRAKALLKKLAKDVYVYGAYDPTATDFSDAYWGDCPEEET